MKNMNPFERGAKEPALIAGRYTLAALSGAVRIVKGEQK